MIGKMKKISVDISIFNSTNSIMKLYQRLSDTISLLTNHYEIVFVNDSCGVNSSDIIHRLAENDSKVICFNLTKYFGQQNALLFGIRQSKYLIGLVYSPKIFLDA